MDIEYNEVRWPTRALQQEEEEQAIAGAERNLLPFELEWTQGSTQMTNPNLLVVTTSPASSALLLAAMPAEAQVVGHIEAPSMAGQTAPDTDKAEPPAALYAAQPGVLVCCCSGVVAPEHAGAWARGVLGQVQPQRLLLLGSMQAEQYRGEADASQELLAFVLRSTVLRQQQQQQQATGAHEATTQSSVPYLPSGSIVSGLPAELLTQAELAGLPAELMVVVEQVPSLVPETLQQLGQLVAAAVQQSLTAQGHPGSATEQQWAASLSASSVVDAARLKLQRTAYRPSSVYS